MTLVYSRRVIRENLCIWRSHQESELPVGTDFSQNSQPYIVLKLLHYSHAMLVLHWPWFTSTQCLFFIGYSLHSHIPWFQKSFCRFYLRPDIFVNNICRVHRMSRWSYLPNPSTRAGYDTRSIFKWSLQVWIQSFPSPRLVASPRLKNPVYPTIYP